MAARRRGPSTPGGAGRRSRRRSARARSSASARRARSRAAAARDRARASAAVKPGAVDEVAAVARQRDAVASSRCRRERGLAYWPAMRPTRMIGFLSPCTQHEAHLQQDLELLRDDVGRAVVEGLGAVAALQQERARRAAPSRAAPSGARSPRTSRSAAERSSGSPPSRARPGPCNRLLRGLSRLPARGIPVGRDARLRHAIGSLVLRSAHYTLACRQACSSRFADTGRDVPSCCANSETRSSSISQR